ncbi:NRDE family protein [Rhodoferax sp.]|uniref:NRDE family protein n=1 Tax=Rhodoferax sp. TaxID=50421 RepID=UPI0025E2742D|nr:NRDE family protein [Rhodoferax sp.]
MCLLAFQWQPDARAPLTIAANRDELYARPTTALQVWADGHTVAGQDLQGGGTWMGLHRPNGRLAALTNVRDPAAMRADAPSRGGIVTAFLHSGLGADDFAQELAETSDAFNGFNLLLFDGQLLVAFESRQKRHFQPAPGVWAVSNADFNTPWPKLVRLRSGLVSALHTHQAAASPTIAPALEATLWPLLADTRMANDAELPATGVSLALERTLSAAFICTPHYGTRASTLVHHARDRVQIIERSFGAGGVLEPTGTVRLALDGFT